MSKRPRDMKGKPAISVTSRPAAVAAAKQQATSPTLANSSNWILFQYIKTHNINMIKAQLESGDCSTPITDPERLNRTPLHWAAALGRTEIVKYLISIGSDVNALDADMLTPLNLACCPRMEGSNNRASCANCVRLLLEAGADIHSAVNKEVVHHYDFDADFLVSITPLVCATQRYISDSVRVEHSWDSSEIDEAFALVFVLLKDGAFNINQYQPEATSVLTMLDQFSSRSYRANNLQKLVQRYGGKIDRNPF